MRKYTPYFGQPVQFTHKLCRKKRVQRRGNKGLSFNDLNVWMPVECEGSGLFLGFRTLKNGIVDYDVDDGNTFRATEQVKAALICSDSRTRPFYVKAESLIVAHYETIDSAGHCG